MANSISTSTNALATAYAPSQLVAVSASGDALVIWFDGTNVKWSYASSPYSSWTTATLLSSIGGGPRWQAGLHKLSNDNALLVVGNSAGNIVSYLFTYSSGSHNWSVGSAVTVLASGSAYNGGSVAMDIDAQGRVWVAWANNSHVGQIYYSANNGTSWTSSTTFTQVGGGDDPCVGLAYCGNYIVATYCGSSAAWQYIRIDAHSASLGSWSTAANVTNSTMDNTAIATSFCGAPGSNYGVLVGDMGAIPAQYYNSNTDTWSSVTNIGSTNDQKPTLVTDGTNIFCVWSKYSAANNFSLVYKKWTASSQTWDSSSTQLEASGSNIQWANGGYGNSLLGFVYTQGTASPWTVYFDTKSFSAASTRTIPTSAALQTTLTRTVPSQAALATTPTRTIPSSAPLQTTNTRTVPASAALQATNTRTIPTSAALQATNARAVPASAALQAINTRTIPSSAALQQTAQQTIPASAALFETKARTIPASAPLQTTNSRSVPGSAALTTAIARAVPTTAALQTTNARTIPTDAAIGSGAQRTIPASAALQMTNARTIPSTAALQTTAARTIPSSGAFQTTNARTIPTLASLQATNTRSIPTQAVLQATNSRTIPTSAAIGSGLARNIPASAALRTTSTRDILSSAPLQTTNIRALPASTALTTTNIRNIPGSAPLQTTNTRTVPGSAALAIPRRSIPTSAALFTTNVRNIPTSASIEAGIVETNVTLYVRSGQADMHVPDGSATEYVREGSALIFVRQP